MDATCEHPGLIDDPIDAQPTSTPTPPTPSVTASNIIATTYHSVIESTTHDNHPAVIKRFTFPDNPRTHHRWRKEVEALNLARDHPNISQILTSTPSPPTITLRHEPGLSLEKHTSPQTSICTLSHSDALAIWSQIASALSHLHSTCNIIHDDVKPENIIFFFPSLHSTSREEHPQPHAVLLDFGAAITLPFPLPSSPISPSPSLNIWSPSGTPPYAPPEFLRRTKSHASDIWGLGVTLLFCFGYIPLPTGSWILPHVFENEAVKQEMVAWLDSIEELRTSLSGSGDAEKVLLGRMLERDPEVRVGSSEIVRLLGS
ncbi:hypothetical protein HER10_EVM0003278 [Colletotrichum scovillei]|uniref:Serine/threonine protein kinase n=1 Tax=Colletotrichum scovillei TaxID=1209932 RepID=A0A9P7QX02_9PEZI|nr:uncharacterized protein HER10_EVM0003278 [Colletotrichum scovillei]KAF4784038.1 hypothetical protein HER10_EVM0003278 [Colletotrichum scovillei]KAG7044945.1 serine/threonine protein kinase [Colletotrichum scovillei]KAG7049656.1 serine/threonine protein kinase [Colletotrichum scovillei]KAG7064398.1 serine/threonine protein kinase [Colletotrichum scovillei]